MRGTWGPGAVESERGNAVSVIMVLRPVLTSRQFTDGETEAQGGGSAL